jgi:hypothetical protein
VTSTLSPGAHLHRGDQADRDGTGLEHRDGVFQRQALGYLVGVVGLGERQLGVAAGHADGGGHDVLADQRRVRAIADRHDPPARFESRHVGPGEGVTARPDDDVAVVDPGHFDRDQDLALRRGRVLGLLDAEDFRRTELTDPDGFHGMAPRWTDWHSYPSETACLGRSALCSSSLAIRRRT